MKDYCNELTSSTTRKWSARSHTASLAPRPRHRRPPAQRCVSPKGPKRRTRARVECSRARMRRTCAKGGEKWSERRTGRRGRRKGRGRDRERERERVGSKDGDEMNRAGNQDKRASRKVGQTESHGARITAQPTPRKTKREEDGGDRSKRHAVQIEEE